MQRIARVQQQGKILAWLKQQLRPPGVIIGVVEIVARVKPVFYVAAVVVSGKGQPPRHGVGQTAGDRPLGFHLVMLADSDLAVAAKLLLGFVGHEMRQAAGRVAPVQGALGAPQDLHALHVKQHETGARHL